MSRSCLLSMNSLLPSTYLTIVHWSFNMQTSRNSTLTAHTSRSCLALMHASRTSKATATFTDKTSELPKLDVPTFDGDVLHWQPFWEQFKTFTHNHSSLYNSKKLVYLQQAIRSGSARTAIEGLSHSGDQYDEAVGFLKERYNRSHLIHRAYVRTIIDTPPLKGWQWERITTLS